MRRDDTGLYLRENIEDARTRFSRALLRVENMRRRDAHMPVLPRSTEVRLPMGPGADMYLLNLDVWRMRHCVSAEFVVDALLTRFHYQRRLPPPASPEVVHLGLAASTMGGVEARRAVEERAAREFPNRENVRARRQAPAPPMPGLDAADGDLVAAYVAAQRRLAAPVKETVAGRAYRRSVV